MIEHHSWHTIHSMSLQFKTNHAALAASAEAFLRYFPEVPSHDTETMSITFAAVSNWNNIPDPLLSSCSVPDARGQLRGIDVDKTQARRMYYADPGRLVLEDPHKGCRLIIKEPQGEAKGYFVHPETLAAEHHMRLLQFVVGRLLKVRGYFTLHATALERHGYSILIPGNSGQGKTTAFLSLLRSGYRCLSDDHPLVHDHNNRLEILSFPEKVDVTEETIKLFPELQQADRFLHQGMRKRFFYIEDIYPNGVGAPSRPGLILFPEVVAQPTSVLEPIPKKQAFEFLLQQREWIQQPAVARREFQILSRLVTQSACYRLRFGRDLLALPKLIAPLLGRD
jgi:hypothetical protein